MSSTADLVAALKRELKEAGITYARLAAELGVAESTIKRSFARGELTLARVDAVLRVLQLDFAELARRIADRSPPSVELTLAQEEAVVADPALMLVALCCLSEWTREQIVERYRMSRADCVACLVRLDRLGVIELRANDRYRLRVTKGHRWRPAGPVMQYFREQVIAEYFAGDFAGEEDLLLLVHGSIGRDMAASFNDRLRRLAQDYARQHHLDQRLPVEQRQPFTMILALRRWEFSVLRDLQRGAIPWAAVGQPGTDQRPGRMAGRSAQGARSPRRSRS